MTTPCRGCDCYRVLRSAAEGDAAAEHVQNIGMIQRYQLSVLKEEERSSPRVSIF